MQDDPDQKKTESLTAVESENFSTYLTAVALSLLTVDRDFWNVAIHEDLN